MDAVQVSLFAAYKKRQNNGKHGLQLTEIDEEPENNVRLLSRDNII